MKKLQYITDSRAAYALTGLRHLKKCIWSTGKFTLEAVYKNQIITTEYASQSERDITFDAICDGLKAKDSE